MPVDEPGACGAPAADEARGREGLGLVEHTIEPVFDERSRVLVLGTMPSPASRAAGFYYGHPRNRFWPVMAAVFGEATPPPDVPARRAFALEHGVALWDVLARCAIRGAADATIADPVPNDLGRVLRAAPVSTVFCTGATAYDLYRRLCEPVWGIPAVKLPSTSPANASWSLERLVEAYRVVAQAALPGSDGLDDNDAGRVRPVSRCPVRLP